MSVTLGEYARLQYPGHATDLWRGSNPQLQDHTVVVHVIGRDTAEQAIGLFERTVASEDVAAVLVLGTEPTVVPTGGEDRDGVVDLPNKRIVAGAATGAVIGLMVAIVIGMIIGIPAGAMVAVCVFLTLAGGAVGGIVGGGRLASERSSTQARAPGDDIGVVAALVDDEHAANTLAGDLADAGMFDVRIVSADGAWHSPA